MVQLTGLIRYPIETGLDFQRAFSGSLQRLGSVLADCKPTVLSHNLLRELREPLRVHGNDMSVVCINPLKTV